MLEHLVKLGYSPGIFVCYCRKCHKYTSGRDPGSFLCKPCAEELYELLYGDNDRDGRKVEVSVEPCPRSRLMDAESLLAEAEKRLPWVDGDYPSIREKIHMFLRGS